MNESKMGKHLKPYDYKIGNPDNDGAKVVKIYAKLPDFVIYRSDSAIRIDLNDDSENVQDCLSRHHNIGVDLARIYSWLPEKLSWSEPINKQIARAMATNVSGNFAHAKEMLSHAEERIISLKVIQGRIQYTLSAFLMVFLIFIASLLISSDEAQLYSRVMLCGALGGILSIAVGYRKLSIDIDANWKTNSLIGASRIVIAFTASLFSYFAIKSGLAFSFIKEEQSIYGVYLISMVAGFTEMLIPSMMSNLANKSTEVNESELKNLTKHEQAPTKERVG